MATEISVVIPVFNREESIPRAIQSVLEQTFFDCEVIVVDDCSTDDTLTVLRSFTDPRIKIVTLEKNSGAAAARNAGIKLCMGRYVSFLDSDDLFEPTFLEQSVKKFNEVTEGVGMIWTGVRFLKTVNNKPVIKESIWRPKLEDPYYSFLSDLRIGTNSGITIRRSVFERVGLFDESLPAAEDTDLFLRIAQHYDIDYIDRYLITIDQRGKDRLSKRFDKIALAYNKIIPKHLSSIEKSSELRIKYYYKAMWLNFHLGEKALARKYFKFLRSEKKHLMKAWVVFFVFTLFGRRLGSTIHRYVSSNQKD